MKLSKKGTAGFSLIEVIVAIAILGMAIIPLGGGLVLSHRLNARSEQVLQARLDVSSAVEALMAEGIVDPSDTYTFSETVSVTVEEPGFGNPAFRVEVCSTAVEGVSVTTFIRPARHEGGGSG